MTRPDGDIRALTADYERWLGERIPLVGEDLRFKHTEMTNSVLRFLRGTYYLWLWRVAHLLPELLDRPQVPCVGDLHIENFGTWRDHHGTRRWGVNDLDELAWGGYPLDLVRLVTSAVLTPHVALSTKDLCRIVLAEWRAAEPGPAVKLDSPTAANLRDLLPAPTPVAHLIASLTSVPQTDPHRVPAVVRAAASHTVEPGWAPTWYPRRAGTGSLGHPRIAAVGRDHCGHWSVREVKLLGPATTTWLHGRVEAGPGEHFPIVDDLLYGRVVTTLRGPEPSRRVQGWQIRRLAPDVTRIELSQQRSPDTQRRMVRSMARAVAQVHGVDPARLAAARADSATLRDDWLREAVDVMVADIRHCHDQWRRQPVS